MPEQILPKIIVVDDNPMIRDILYKVLKLKGYTVMTASSGQDAIKILHRNSIAVVITDVEMPEMSGEELLHKIKKLFPYMPVIITGDGTLSDAIKLIKQGAANYIPKPFSIDEIYNVVEEALLDSYRVKKPF